MHIHLSSVLEYRLSFFRKRLWPLNTILHACQVLLQQEGLPDGRKIGFVEAFRRAEKPVPCHGCFCFATIEGDLLFSLDPPTVSNTVGYLAGEKVRRLGRLISGGKPAVSRAVSRDPCDGNGPCSCEASEDPAGAEPAAVEPAPPADAEDKDMASVSKA